MPHVSVIAVIAGECATIRSRGQARRSHHGSIDLGHPVVVVVVVAHTPFLSHTQCWERPSCWRGSSPSPASWRA